MTQTFRSRDEQEAALSCELASPNRARDFGVSSARQHILEAEARGAAEERGKVEEIPYAYVRPDDFYCDEGDERFGPWSSIQAGKCTVPLYTRPANVAALEARVKELEAENEKFRNAMSAIATHVGSFASPNCSVDFMTSAIPEEVRLSFTTLTREGGV